MRDDHRKAPVGGNPPADELDPSYADSPLHADDLLLDALGRGEPAPADDPFAGLLATWRADLDDGLSGSDADLVAAFCAEPVDPVRPPAPGALPLVPPVGPGPADQPAASGSADSPAMVPSRPPTAPAGPARTRRRHAAGPAADRRGPARRVGRARRLLIGVATAVVIAAGLGIGANSAGPTSPLWPVARLVYPEQSAVRAAEHEIDLARQAVAARRYDRARTHLNRAEEHTAQVGDPAHAQRLFAEIARLWAVLPPDQRDGPGGPATGRPAVPADPGAPATPVPTAPPDPADQPTGAPAPGDGQPAPTPQPTQRGLLPSLLPSPLLPNLPLVPSLLPSGLPLI